MSEQFFSCYVPRSRQYQFTSAIEPSYIIGKFLANKDPCRGPLAKLFDALIAVAAIVPMLELIDNFSPVAALDLFYRACFRSKFFIPEKFATKKEDPVSQLFEAADATPLPQDPSQRLLQYIYHKIKKKLADFSLKAPNLNQYTTKGKNCFTKKNKLIAKISGGKTMSEEDVLAKIRKCDFTVDNEESLSDSSKLLVEILFCFPQFTKRVAMDIVSFGKSDILDERNDPLDNKQCVAIPKVEYEILTYAFSSLFTEFLPQMESITGFLWFISKLIKGKQSLLLKEAFSSLPPPVMSALIEHLFHLRASSTLKLLLDVADTMEPNMQQTLYFLIALKCQRDFPECAHKFKKKESEYIYKIGGENAVEFVFAKFYCLEKKECETRLNKVFSDLFSQNLQSKLDAIREKLHSLFYQEEMATKHTIFREPNRRNLPLIIEMRYRQKDGVVDRVDQKERGLEKKQELEESNPSRSATKPSGRVRKTYSNRLRRSLRTRHKNG